MAKAKQEQKLFRLSQAAHELGLHPITVRRWIKAGRIGVIQVGREVRIPRSEIEKIVGTLNGGVVVLYGRVSGHGQKGISTPNWSACEAGPRWSAKVWRFWSFLISALASKPGADTSNDYSS